MTRKRNARVKDLPARPQGADVLARELTLANPALLRQFLDDLVDRQAALERLARVPRLSVTRFALGLRQRRTRSLLAIAVTAGRTVRVPAGLPQVRVKLGVLTLQQFQALSQFLNLLGLGEHQLSQGLHLRWDLRSYGSKLTQFQNER